MCDIETFCETLDTEKYGPKDREEVYVNIFHPCKSSGERIDTMEFYFAGKMYPVLKKNEEIAVWVVSCDEPLKRKNDDNEEYEMLPLPPLPYTLRQRVGKIPAHLTGSTNIRDKLMKVYFRFKVDGIEVKVVFEGAKRRKGKGKKVKPFEDTEIILVEGGV